MGHISNWMFSYILHLELKRFRQGAIRNLMGLVMKWDTTTVFPVSTEYPCRLSLKVSADNNIQYIATLACTEYSKIFL